LLHLFVQLASNGSSNNSAVNKIQSTVDSNIGSIGMTDEQNDTLAKILYKKIPTNCEFDKEFKLRTKAYLAKNNTKFDNIIAVCFRIRNLLAEFRELGRRRKSFAPPRLRFRIKYED
jgi:Mo-dependent nitrogenase C-terminus